MGGSGRVTASTFNPSGLFKDQVQQVQLKQCSPPSFMEPDKSNRVIAGEGGGDFFSAVTDKSEMRSFQLR